MYFNKQPGGNRGFFRDYFLQRINTRVLLRCLFPVAGPRQNTEDRLMIMKGYFGYFGFGYTDRQVVRILG